MDAKLVDAALLDKPKEYLEQRHLVLFANISRMPTMVAPCVLGLG